MRTGVRLGVDVGSVRVGVSACDPDAVLAYPVRTIRRDPAGGGPNGIRAGQGGEDMSSDIAELAKLADDLAVIEVVVGLPLSLDGSHGVAAELARGYSRAIAQALAPRPVRLFDERLSTVDAHRNLRSSGVAGRAQRGVVDQAAAVLILQTALDLERTTGLPPGSPVTSDRRKPRRKGRA